MNKKKLSQHVHKVEKFYTCSYCEVNFYESMQLQEHIKAIHGSKKHHYASKHDSRLNTHFHNIVKSNVSQTKIGDYKYQNSLK